MSDWCEHDYRPGKCEWCRDIETIALLRDRLRPFAEAADSMLDDDNRDEDTFAELFIDGGPTVADFRAASAALKGQK